MRWVLSSLLGAAVLLACAGLVGGIGAQWSIGYLGFIDTDPEDVYVLVLIVISSAILLAYGVRGVTLVLRNKYYRLGLVGKLCSGLLIVFGAYLIFIAIVSAPDRYLLLPGVVVVASPAAYFWLGRLRPSPNE